jgi:hypothetical protein
VLRQEQAEKDVTKALERSQKQHIADDITKQQDELQRGEVSGGVPDRDAIIQQSEQRNLDEEYMQRGEPPKESPVLRFLGDISAPLREEE